MVETSHSRGGYPHPRRRSLVELRPVAEHHKAERRERLAAREALRQLQSHARLTSNEAQDFLKELREERLAADMRRPA